MNYNKKTIMDVDVAGKKILLRCDFNVPQDKATGAITSDKRIVAALPTIRYLLERGAAVIACSHLGKPKGQWKESLTLAPVAERLSRLLGQEVIFIGDGVKRFKEYFIKELGSLSHFAPAHLCASRASCVAFMAESMAAEAKDPNELNPVYLRLSQAEREYNEKENKGKE